MNPYSELMPILEGKKGDARKKSQTRAIYRAAENEGQRRLYRQDRDQGGKPRTGDPIKIGRPEKKKKPRKRTASVTKGRDNSRIARLKRAIAVTFSAKAARKEGRRQGTRMVDKREIARDTHHKTTMQKFAARQTASRAGVKYKDLPHGGGKDDNPHLSFVKPKVLPRSKRH